MLVRVFNNTWNGGGGGGGGSRLPRTRRCTGQYLHIKLAKIAACAIAQIWVLSTMTTKLLVSGERIST